MSVDIVRLADRSELTDRCWELTPLWPRFMLQDPIADLYYERIERYAATAWVALAGDEVVGRAFAVPFAMGEDVGRTVLPSDGWDGVVRWAWLDDHERREPTHLSALEIVIAPQHRGTELAGRFVATMRTSARELGLGSLVAPVRPSRKHEEPGTPMAEYAARTRDDGLPHDPWLRLHVRAGGRIHSVCPRSMTISGTLAEWRDWCSLPFDRSGPLEVPGGLVPVHVDVEQDHAVYVEPNVWVIHRP